MISKLQASVNVQVIATFIESFFFFNLSQRTCFFYLILIHLSVCLHTHTHTALNMNIDPRVDMVDSTYVLLSGSLFHYPPFGQPCMQPLLSQSLTRTRQCSRISSPLLTQCCRPVYAAHAIQLLLLYPCPRRVSINAEVFCSTRQISFRYH